MIKQSIIKPILICYVIISFQFISTISFSQSTINITAQNEPEQFDNIKVIPLFTDSLSSSFLIWIKTEVKPHKHAFHSEQVYVLQGNGTMMLEEKELVINPGDLIYIPKNTIHSVQVISEHPMKVISTQAPIFEGKDRIFIKD